jgi:hypothetical protein
MPDDSADGNDTGAGADADYRCHRAALEHNTPGPTSRTSTVGFERNIDAKPRRRGCCGFRTHGRRHDAIVDHRIVFTGA